MHRPVQQRHTELELRVDCAPASLDDVALLCSVNALLECDSKPAKDLRIVPLPAGRCAVRVRSLSIAEAERAWRKIHARRGLQFDSNGHIAVATRIIRHPEENHCGGRRLARHATAPQQERYRFAAGSRCLGGERSEFKSYCPAQSSGDAALRRSASAKQCSESFVLNAGTPVSKSDTKASESLVTDDVLSDADKVAADTELAFRRSLCSNLCGLPLHKDDNRARLFDTVLHRAISDEVRFDSKKSNALGLSTDTCSTNKGTGCNDEGVHFENTDIVRQQAVEHVEVAQDHIHVALPPHVEGLSSLPHADQLPPGRSILELDCGTRGRQWPLSALIDLLGAFPTCSESNIDSMDVATAKDVHGLNKAAIVELHRCFYKRATSSATHGNPRLLSIRSLCLVLAECHCGAHRPQETFFGGDFEASVDKLNPRRQRQDLLRFYPVPTNVVILLRSAGCHVQPLDSTARADDQPRPRSNPKKCQRSSRAFPCAISSDAEDVNMDMPYLTFAELIRVFCTWVDERIALAIARRDEWERILRAGDGKDKHEHLSEAAESGFDSFIARTRDQLKKLTERLDTTRLQTEALQVLLEPLTCDICGTDVGEAPEKIWEYLEPMMQNGEAFFTHDAAGESEDGCKLWLDTDKVFARLPERLQRCFECSNESGERSCKNDEFDGKLNPSFSTLTKSGRATVADAAHPHKVSANPSLAQQAAEPASPIDAIVQQARADLIDMQIYEGEVIAEDAENHLLNVLTNALAVAGVERQTEAQIALREAFAAACAEPHGVNVVKLTSLAQAESALRAAWLQLSIKATV